MLEALMAPPRRPISKSDKLYFIQSNSRDNKTESTNEIIENDADSQSAVAVDSSSIEISFEEEEINLDDFEAIHAAELKESLEIPEIVELLEFEDQLARDKKEAPHLREKMRSSPEIKWDDYENTFSENYEVVLSPGDMQAVEGAAVESSNQLNSDSNSDSSDSTDQLEESIDQSEATLDEILDDDTEEPMEVAFNVPGQDDDSFSSDSYYDDSYDYDDLAPGAFEGDDVYEPTTTIATTVSVGTGADEPDFYEPTTMMPTTILSTTLPKLTTVKTSTGTKMTEGEEGHNVGGVNPDESRQGPANDDETITTDETNNGRTRLDYDPLDNVQPELKHIFNVQENDGATGNKNDILRNNYYVIIKQRHFYCRKMVHCGRNDQFFEKPNFYEYAKN